MAQEHPEFPKVLTLYLELSQFPILAPRIRERMRGELFRRGVIHPEAFEAEVRQKAIQSQHREGLQDPLRQEKPDVWQGRQAIIRDYLTDFYFAYNLPHEVFEELVRETLADRAAADDLVLIFHPELAPWDMLFAQGEAYEALPEEERARVQHHLEEIKVVLIKAMISDHLAYVGVAKEWFDVADLQAIRGRRIGRGKIGGKAAGLMLAECILRKSADAQALESLRIPKSWFLGADVFYQFTHINRVLDYANQKYRTEEEIRADYPAIRERFREGRFPEEVAEGLRAILREVGDTPLIVRSSSLLEDSFGTSFAGKYESHFCPNQGSLKENLKQLLTAIGLVYASVYSPDALLYRRRMGLLDYDERMAVLIQQVLGRRVGRFYLPDAAGVAFSRNQFRWSPRIDRHAGFVRLVWGLGTRAVEPWEGDYPRLVALSHPDLRPETSPKEIRRYSQQQVDLIDLGQNAFRTLPVHQVVGAQVPNLRWIAQRIQDDHLQSFVSLPLQLDPRQVTLTFDGLLRRTRFAATMRHALERLEAAYGEPVDTEFAALVDEPPDGEPRVAIYILQCRPQSRLEAEKVRVPTNIPADRRLFVSRRMVPDGRVSGVRYAVYVTPQGYSRLSEPAQRAEVARVIGRLNHKLGEEGFLLIGPGRWGSANPDLGIPVTYADIYHARALVEMTSEELPVEPSYGTHFFQDLMEARIYPLAVSLEDGKGEFNRTFFESSPNLLASLLPEDGVWSEAVRVIDIAAASGGRALELVMDGDAGVALAFLS